MNNFDSDSTFGAEMRGAINGTHSSFPKELFDLIFVIECLHVTSKNLQRSPISYRLSGVSS